MRRFELIVSALLVVFFIDVLLYFFQPLGQDFFIIADLTSMAFSFLAVVFGIYAYRSHQFSDAQGKALFFLTFGIFLWFLGETTWAIYEINFGLLTPSPTIADFFWISAYPLFLISLSYIWRLALWPIGKKWFILLAFILLTVSFSLWYFSIPTLIGPSLSPAEKISTAGYVLGDMLVLNSLIIVMAYLFKNKLLKAWGLILLGTVFSTIADVLYTHTYAAYMSGNLIDLFWDFSYIIFAIAFLYYRSKWQQVLSKT